MTPVHTRTGNLVGAILLLVLFAALGVRHSFSAAGADLSTGAHAVVLLQWGYAGLAALAIVGLLIRHAGTRWVLYAWAAIFVARNTLTPMYFGGKGLGPALAGGAIGLAIALGILYLGLAAFEPDPGPTPT
jgi:hypothetical protein